MHTRPGAPGDFQDDEQVRKRRHLEPLFFGSHEAHRTFSRIHKSNPIHTSSPIHDHMDRHAWIVLGTKTIFLWHMVMGWMQGHNYEVVLEVELPPDALREILEDRKRDGHTHILGNRVGSAPLYDDQASGHSVPELMAGNIRQFVADVWNFVPTKPCGPLWPYSESSAFLKEVEVQVKRVVHYRHLNLNITAQRFESYLLFGSGREAHVCHTLVDQPDYDHAATLKAPPDWLEPAKLAAGIIVSVPALPWSPDRTSCINPLRDGSSECVLYHGIERYRPMPSPSGQPIKPNELVPPLTIDMDRTWWFSTRVVNYPLEDPCGGLGEIPEPRPDPDCPPESGQSGGGHHHGGGSNLGGHDHG